MDVLFEKIFYRAISTNATDIHLVLREHLSIKFRVYSEFIEYDQIDYDIGLRFVNYLKYKAHIDTNFRLLPQTGHFKFDFNSYLYNLRVSYLPSMDFESIVIRVLNNHKSITIDELTLIDDVNEYLKSITLKQSGLFVISGSTGSGKTTTLYSLLNEISKQSKNVISLEDPIEIESDNFLQIEINEQMGITYTSVLKQVLRHDPDVIMIGEIRDEETAKMAIRCALTGHLVLTTVHAGNAYLALKRLLNLNISQLDLEDCLIGSLCLRLKHDFKDHKVYILPEIMKRDEILKCLYHDDFHYKTFKEHAFDLIENNYDQSLFKEEFNE